MATKFYLPSSGTASQNPAWSASWYNATGFSASKLYCYETKPNSGLSTKTLTEADVTDRHFAVGMWISRPLAAQTILNGTVITGSMQASEDNAKNNLSLHFIIRLLQSDGTTYRSTIIAFTDDVTEANSSLRSLAFTATLGGDVAVTAGDMIVIELGIGGDPASGGGSHNSTMRIGETTSGTDLAYTDADTSATAIPWVDFSQTLTYISAVPANTSQLQTSDNVALVQHNVLATDGGASQLHAADGPLALVQHNVLAIANTSQLHTADNVVLTAYAPAVVLVVADATHVHTVDNVVLVQHNILVVQDTSQLHAVDSFALIQHNILVVANTQHLQIADNTGLGVGLIVSDATQTHTADNISLGVILVVDDAQHLQIVESVFLGIGLIVNDASQLQTADNLTLVAYAPHFDLVVQDSEHLHTSNNVDIVQHNILVVDSCLHEQTSQNITIGGIDANPDSTEHLHTADNVTLVQHNVLAVSTSEQLHVVENVVLVQHYFILVDSCQHLQTSNNAILTQHNVLAVDSSTQAQITDNLLLIQHNILVIDSSQHLQESENAILTAHEPGALSLTIQDATHLQSVDNTVLTQHNLLEVSTSTHLQYSDEVSLTVILIVDDASQLQSADNISLELGQFILIVQNAFHAQYADKVTFPGFEPVEEDGVFRKPFQKIFRSF